MRWCAVVPLVTLVVVAGCPAAPPVHGHVDAAPPAADAAATAAPGFRGQVLYLVLVDRFRNGDANNDRASGCFDPTRLDASHGGDFEGLRQHLDYVRELGASAVWITPPNRQIATGCGYHGYWIDYADPADPDAAALAPNLGTPAELDHLIGDLRATGMQLVLDMVVNHAGDSARIAQQHPGWFHPEATCGALGPPEIYCPLNHHPDFAQEQPAVAAYLTGVETATVSRYAVDAIRMDTAKHVLASYFAHSFFPALRAARPNLFAVAEIWDEGSTQSFVPYLDAGFTSAFHFPLRRALLDAVAHAGSIDRVADAIADGIARVGADRALDLVLFVDNHDVPRFANEPGLGVTEDEIRRRLELALDLIFTLPGIPQLYYGDELGMYGGADPDNRRDLPAWATDAAARAAAHPGEAVAGSAHVFARVQQLAALRRSVAALGTGAYRERWRQGGAGRPNVLAFTRGSGATLRLVVVNNGGTGSGVLAIPLAELAAGTMLDDELGDGAPSAVTISAGAATVELPARTAAIYRVRGS